MGGGGLRKRAAGRPELMGGLGETGPWGRLQERPGLQITDPSFTKTAQESDERPNHGWSSGTAELC